MRLKAISQSALNQLKQHQGKCPSYIDRLVDGTLSVADARAIEAIVCEGWGQSPAQDFITLTARFLSPRAFYRLVRVAVQANPDANNAKFFQINSFALKLYQHHLHNLQLPQQIDHLLLDLSHGYRVNSSVKLQAFLQKLMPVWKIFKNTDLSWEDFADSFETRYPKLLKTIGKEALNYRENFKIRFSDKPSFFATKLRAKQCFYQSCRLSKATRLRHFLRRNLSIVFLMLSIVCLSLTAACIFSCIAGCLPVLACIIIASVTFSAFLNFSQLLLNHFKQRIKKMPFEAPEITERVVDPCLSMQR